jgi:hypothetical protein
MDLIAGRVCGECTQCCTWVAIRDPQLRKLAGETCTHCISAKGCGIYERRPAPCREFHCAWRALPQLGDEWRPDRSEILIEFDADGVPPGYPVPALKFTFLGNIQRLEWPPFLNLVARLVEQRVPMFIAVPIHKEYAAVKTFITDGLREAVAARNPQTLLLELSRAALYGMATPGEKYDLGNSG